MAFICRSVKALLRLAGAALGDVEAVEQVCSPIAEISISSPQLEHLTVGRKLAGRTPLAARVAASDMLKSFDYACCIMRVPLVLPCVWHLFKRAVSFAKHVIPDVMIRRQPGLVLVVNPRWIVGLGLSMPVDRIER